MLEDESLVVEVSIPTDRWRHKKLGLGAPTFIL